MGALGGVGHQAGSITGGTRGTWRASQPWAGRSAESRVWSLGGLALPLLCLPVPLLSPSPRFPPLPGPPLPLLLCLFPAFGSSLQPAGKAGGGQVGWVGAGDPS